VQNAATVRVVRPREISFPAAHALLAYTVYITIKNDAPYSNASYYVQHNLFFPFVDMMFAV